MSVGVRVGVGVWVGELVGSPGEGVPVGVEMGVVVGPARATAGQIVTPSATITRVPTKKRRIVELDTALPPQVKTLNGAKRPTSGPLDLKLLSWMRLAAEMSSLF